MAIRNASGARALKPRKDTVTTPRFCMANKKVAAANRTITLRCTQRMAASLRIETVRGGMIAGAAIPPQAAGYGAAASIVDKAMSQAHAVCALALALAGAN